MYVRGTRLARMPSLWICRRWRETPTRRRPYLHVTYSTPEYMHLGHVQVLLPAYGYNQYSLVFFIDAGISVGSSPVPLVAPKAKGSRLARPSHALNLVHAITTGSWITTVITAAAHLSRRYLYIGRSIILSNILARATRRTARPVTFRRLLWYGHPQPVHPEFWFYKVSPLPSF